MNYDPPKYTHFAGMIKVALLFACPSRDFLVKRPLKSVLSAYGSQTEIPILTVSQLCSSFAVSIRCCCQLAFHLVKLRYVVSSTCSDKRLSKFTWRLLDSTITEHCCVRLSHSGEPLEEYRRLLDDSIVRHFGSGCATLSYISGGEFDEWATDCRNQRVAHCAGNRHHKLIVSRG